MNSEKLRKMTGFTLEDLLPHRGKMLLIDDVLEVDDSSAVTEALVSASYPMAEAEGVSPLIMVELAAQTAGVCNGLSRVKREGEDSSKMGWLVGVKRAQFYIDSIALGSRLVIRSRNTHEFDSLREVSCVLHLDDVEIAEITLQLIQA